MTLFIIGWMLQMTLTGGLSLYSFWHDSYLLGAINAGLFVVGLVMLTLTIVLR